MKTLKFLPLAIALVIAGCGEKTPPAAQTTPAAPAPAVATAPAAPAPVAPTQPAAPAVSAAPAPVASAATAGDLVKGEQVYAATCVACHGAGVLGAPKFGDKALWGPRIAQGIDTLHTNAINGIRMMPPKGGNAALKDEDVKAAVDYMVSKAS
ncbi:MAG: cytochrome c5 family protein [Glaciimonas sp.]|nr:cytochrome c5 family protein [Glaciimonas sp.]